MVQLVITIITAQNTKNCFRCTYYTPGVVPTFNYSEDIKPDIIKIQFGMTFNYWDSVYHPKTPKKFTVLDPI